MIEIIYQRGYPFIAIGAIEIGKVIQQANEVILLLVFILQVIIGCLTIAKIFKELKGNKKATLEEIEKKVSNKNPYLTVFSKFFKNFKIGK